jgi:hypothetical protein
MSIILYHKSTPIPNHLKDCVAKIRQYSNLPIYLLSDSDYTEHGVKCINVNNYSDLNWLNNINFLHTHVKDRAYHMWRESSFRLFYIKKFIEENNLSNVLTFDNDILLYENPEKIIELMANKYDGFALTPNCHDEVSMGMVFIKNTECISKLCNFFKQELMLPPKELNLKYQGYPTEMRILTHYSECQMLPILPTGLTTERYTNNFEYFNAVFDPSSYGQFIGGLSPLNESVPNPGWFHEYQQIGKYIKSKEIQILFENRNPYLIYKNNKIKINSLHIHSKQTHKYL